MTKPYEELWAVAPGKCLEWPEEIGGGFRGGPATVVRRDDPLIPQRAWDSGVLAPAPEGVQVTTVTHGPAKARYAELGYMGVPMADPPKPATRADELRQEIDATDESDPRLLELEAALTAELADQGGPPASVQPAHFAAPPVPEPDEDLEE